MCFIWVYMARLWGGGLQRVPLPEDTRGCPSYLTEPVPRGSKTDALLPKDAQHLGGWSKKNVGEIHLQTLKSMKKEVEGMLQTPNRFLLSLWKRWCPSSPWRTCPGTGRYSLKEVSVPGEHVPEQELWPLGRPLWSSLILKAHTLWKEPMCCLERILCLPG